MVAPRRTKLLPRVRKICLSLPEAQETLVEADPGHFFAPPYVGPAGWIGIHLDKGLDWDVIAGLVREGYLEVAPKRLREDVTASPPAAPRARGAGRRRHR